MTEFTRRELSEIVKHLEKVREISELNAHSGEVRIDIPNNIPLFKTSHGMPLGSIEWSDEREEYVFVTDEEKPEPKRDTSHIPLPPWPHS